MLNLAVNEYLPVRDSGTETEIRLTLACHSYGTENDISEVTHTKVYPVFFAQIPDESSRSYYFHCCGFTRQQHAGSDEYQKLLSLHAAKNAVLMSVNMTIQVKVGQHPIRSVLRQTHSQSVIKVQPDISPRPRHSRLAVGHARSNPTVTVFTHLRAV